MTFDPNPYLAAGIPQDEARRWWHWHLTAEQARAWRRAGVTDPALAVQWATAHITPETVGACHVAGLSAAEALLWHEYEFELDDALTYRKQSLTPDQAFDLVRGREPGSRDDPFGSLMAFTGGGEPQDPTQRFLARAGRADALVVYGYIKENWTDDEAGAWAGHNIDAATARMWKELGLRPSEAARHVRRGLGPMAVARAWWQAGIPFEETASWAGAGLTPAEAAGERARGVTAEQAEALRALRFDS
ncbi:hypothetical protein ABZ897_46200 [Nonomuraea sp. NPDC046802]|uniref:hypothetical protein n=1 Tax=Nonomuraea sp. NPDC046802 TaxID=3154919 RepID=UPI0033D1E629